MCCPGGSTRCAHCGERGVELKREVDACLREGEEEGWERLWQEEHVDVEEFRGEKPPASLARILATSSSLAPGSAMSDAARVRAANLRTLVSVVQRLRRRSASKTWR